jgi:hypothetical protein
MVDLIGKFRSMLPQGVVRQFRQMHDSIEAAQVFFCDESDVLVDTGG